MAHNSIRGDFHQKEVARLARRVIYNAGFLTPDDLKVLEYLSNKGTYPNKKLIFKNNK